MAYVIKAQAHSMAPLGLTLEDGSLVVLEFVDGIATTYREDVAEYVSKHLFRMLKVEKVTEPEPPATVPEVPMIEATLADDVVDPSNGAIIAEAGDVVEIPKVVPEEDVEPPPPPVRQAVVSGLKPSKKHR